MIVVSFTARPPRGSDLPLVESEMLAAHRYGNRLRELERNRRTAVRVAQRLLSPEIDAIEREIDEIEERIGAVRAGIRKRRAAARAGSAATPEECAALDEEFDALRAARARAKEPRALLQKTRKMRAVYRLIDRYNRQGRIMARAKAGCYWGTYLQVEAAIAAAAKEPGDGPRFARWEGEGKIAVQLQGGLTWDDAIGGADTRLRVETVSGDEWLARQGKTRKGPARTPGSRRDSGSRAVQYAIVWLRAGSEGRRPIWVQVPVEIDRAIPPGKVMWAWLQRRALPSIGEHGSPWRWEVQLVIRTEEAPPSSTGRGTVAVNLGWRRIETGLRVAYWVDDAGQEGQVVLPQDVLGQLDKAAELRSLRDRLFDQMRAAVGAFLAPLEGLPESFQHARRWMPQWKESDRLVRLRAAWAEQRLPGDDGIFASLSDWAKQDAHLHAWEFHARRNAYLRRTDLYCCFAAELAARYQVVLMEAHDLRESASAPKEEKGTRGEGQVLREQQRRAAPHEMRSRIKSTCGRLGVMVPLGKPEHTTQRCHACGHLEKWDAAESIWHTCGGCGGRWDQDANNCRNQIRLHRERSGDTQLPPVEKKPAGSRRFGGARKGARKSAQGEEK